jgi:hypothetical protein
MQRDELVAFLRQEVAQQLAAAGAGAGRTK